ncbi:hypothetical protein BJX99DRAFT_257234 [Aspergillus californicus]
MPDFILEQDPHGYDYLPPDNEWLYLPTSPPALSPPSSSLHTGTLSSLCATPELDPLLFIDGAHCTDVAEFGLEYPIPEERLQKRPTSKEMAAFSDMRSHTIHFMVRALRSWPRIMAMYGAEQLPPIMHSVQFENGIPAPLVNCFALVQCWAAGVEDSVEVIRDSILFEIRRIIGEHQTYNDTDLLAAMQSLLMLLIIMFFGLEKSPTISTPIEPQLLLDAWEVRNRLATTGLFLDQDPTHTPSWKEWALINAKQRTILGLHHLDFAWSDLRGYPMLSCYELGPLPAPVSRFLWQAVEEEAWSRFYSAWRHQWKDGAVVISEFFDIKPGQNLDDRAERWLAEADELGMMLMAEINGY